MSDKGIIFSAPMVRALLDGRKNQTRRLLKDAPKGDWHCDRVGSGLRWVASPGSPSLPCLLPFASGDRLYVREACWIAPPGWTDSPVNPMGPHRQEVAFKADDRGYTADAAKDYGLKLRPSIHMPRWASRLWLEVRDVRVERVASISREDAIAEGIHCFNPYSVDTWSAEPGGAFASWPEGAFMQLWNSLHTKPGERWQDNPWVVAVSFDVHRGNIDQ